MRQYTASTFLRDLSILFHAILLVELFDTSTSLVSLLLSSIEWMTLRTDFYVDLRLCRTCNECVSTVAGNGCLIIIWMDSFSHDFHLFIFLSFSVISLPTDSGSCHTLYTRMPDPHMILITRATLSSVYIPINSLIIVAHESVNCKTFL